MQPPGQLYAEYNPNPALARGGHFFTYGTMHHTHSSRCLEVTEGNTMQNHEYIDETLRRMAALIPRLPPDQLSGKCDCNVACSVPLTLLSEKDCITGHCWHFVVWFLIRGSFRHDAQRSCPARKRNLWPYDRLATPVPTRSLRRFCNTWTFAHKTCLTS